MSSIIFYHSLGWSSKDRLVLLIACLIKGHIADLKILTAAEAFTDQMYVELSWNLKGL